MPQPAYVNSGADTSVVVSANGVSGLTLTMPAALVVGNWLLAHVAFRPSANFADDDVQATAAGAVWNLLFATSQSNFRHLAWWKFVTGGEGNLSILATAVGTLGSANSRGMVHQFQNVHNPGTATFIEAENVTYITTSGPVPDAGITTTGADRFAINLVACNNNVPSVTAHPAGEAGGDWLCLANGVTSGTPQIMLWGATMAVAGTIDGGTKGTNAAANPQMVHGFALAPCEAAAVVSKIPQMMHHYIVHIGNF